MTDTRQRATDQTSGSSRRAALAAAFALTVGVLLLALPGTPSIWMYWAASAVAVGGALALIISGEKAWDHLLTNARAAGVVAPY